VPVGVFGSVKRDADDDDEQPQGALERFSKRAKRS
jgi:hypothetical protein